MDRPDSETPDETGEDGAVDVEEKSPDLDHPKRFAVLLHNDDYTTMEFVIEVLQRFFHKSGEEAAAIMLNVHRHGQGVAGTYNHEIAETKAAQTMDLARERGFPLLCTVEEVL